MKVIKDISYSAYDACKLDVYLPENEPYVMIICSEKDIVNRVEQLHVLRTAMLQFGFPKEKLELKYYPGEVHCGYMAKDFYIQDTFEFINKVVENI